MLSRQIFLFSFRVHCCTIMFRRLLVLWVPVAQNLTSWFYWLLDKLPFHNPGCAPWRDVADEQWSIRNWLATLVLTWQHYTFRKTSRNSYHLWSRIAHICTARVAAVQTIAAGHQILIQVYISESSRCNIYMMQELNDREELKRQQEEFRLEQEEMERHRLEMEKIAQEELEMKKVCC